MADYTVVGIIPQKTRSEIVEAATPREACRIYFERHGIQVDSVEWGDNDMGVVARCEGCDTHIFDDDDYGYSTEDGIYMCAPCVVQERADLQNKPTTEGGK